MSDDHPIHHEHLSELFQQYNTTLADIESAGWLTHVSSNVDWWYLHRSGSTQPVPVWIQQLLRQAREAGKEDVRNEIRTTLHIPKSKQRKGEDHAEN